MWKNIPWSIKVSLDISIPNINRFNEENILAIGFNLSFLNRFAILKIRTGKNLGLNKEIILLSL